MPDETTTDDSSTEDQTTTDPPLGDKGEKALEAWKARAREAEKDAKRAKELETELQQFRDRDKTDQEKALEAARKESSATATKEATAKANARIVRAEVKAAAAGGKMADPNDAVRLLDLDDFSVDDDGEVDAKAIEAAIAQLVKDKPYLAAGGKRPAGDADQGARNGTTPTPDTARGLIAAGLAANEAARSSK